MSVSVQLSPPPSAHGARSLALADVSGQGDKVVPIGCLGGDAQVAEPIGAVEDRCLRVHLGQERVLLVVDDAEVEDVGRELLLDLGSLDAQIGERDDRSLRGQLPQEAGARDDRHVRRVTHPGCVCRRTDWYSVRFGLVLDGDAAGLLERVEHGLERGFLRRRPTGTSR